MTARVHTRLTGDEVEQCRRRQPAVPERLWRVQDPAPDHVVDHEERRHEPTIVLSSRALPKYPCADATRFLSVPQQFSGLLIDLRFGW